jgi:hypothetical protein
MACQVFHFSFEFFLSSSSRHRHIVLHCTCIQIIVWWLSVILRRWKHLSTLIHSFSVASHVIMACYTSLFIKMVNVEHFDAWKSVLTIPMIPEFWEDLASPFFAHSVVWEGRGSVLFVFKRDLFVGLLASILTIFAPLGAHRSFNSVPLFLNSVLLMEGGSWR